MDRSDLSPFVYSRCLITQWSYQACPYFNRSLISSFTSSSYLSPSISLSLCIKLDQVFIGIKLSILPGIGCSDIRPRSLLVGRVASVIFLPGKSVFIYRRKCLRIFQLCKRYRPSAWKGLLIQSQYGKHPGVGNMVSLSCVGLPPKKSSEPLRTSSRRQKPTLFIYLIWVESVFA